MLIRKAEKKYEDEEIYKILNPILANWFKEKYRKFSEPQKYAVVEIHKRENVLISSPTGTGKTFAAFLSILSELLNLEAGNALEDKVYCIYISPLKSLNNDIRKNLLEPFEEIKEKFGFKSKIRIEVRTSDTTNYEKAKMLKKPPHILITTPESLTISLNAPKFSKLLESVEWVVVDEIHALAQNKRGALLSLALERLQRKKSFARIGLSATINPLEDVARFLIGNEERGCLIVDARFEKKLKLSIEIPVEDFIGPDFEEREKKLYSFLGKIIKEHKTTLIFTNTRSATERVVHNLKEMFGEEIGLVGAHHSSVSRDLRLNVEENLKKGKMKAVVSSTSLELGIDIGHIDIVVLLSSPKSVSRALQRIGRAGHKIDETTRGIFVALDKQDLLESAVIMKCCLEKKIDKIKIIHKPLDVLIQHILGLALEGKQNIKDVYEMVKKAYPYKDLTFNEFTSLLKYLSGEYVELEEKNVYSKIWVDFDSGFFGKKGKNIRMIYFLNVGVIPDETKIKVKTKNGVVVGFIEEEFFERLKRGDVFVLGGNIYEFLYARGNAAIVNPDVKKPPNIPSWFSEMLPLAFDTALEIGRFLRYLEESKNKKEFAKTYLHCSEKVAKEIIKYCEEQKKISSLPNDKKIVVEFFEDTHGKHVVFHSIFGRKVNDALSRIFAYLASSLQNKDVEITINDYGFMLTYWGKLNIENLIKLSLERDAEKVLENAIDKTNLLITRFRHNATRSFLILRKYMGRERSVSKQNRLARTMYKLLKEIDPKFPVIKETYREIMEDVFDLENAKKVLKWIKEGKIRLEKKNLKVPSPFSLPLITQGYSDIIKMEQKINFLKKMYEIYSKEFFEGNKK